MATPFPFGSGNVLTAAQMNAITTLPINDQTASYVALVGDVGKRIVMNVATANTVTINDSVFAAGDTIFIANKGAGATTVTAGAGVTINTASSAVLAQHGGGTLVATSASVFTFFSQQSATYGTATGGTSSSITVGGINYTLLTFTTDGTLTITKAGLFDYFVLGSGAGSNTPFNGGGGGGGGQLVEGIAYFDTNEAVTVGAGGASNAFNVGVSRIGDGIFALCGGGAASGTVPSRGSSGAGGQGAGSVIAGAAAFINAVTGHGGGSGSTTSPNFAGGGGGGMGGAGTNASGATAGSAGAGVSNSFDGVATTYGRGGFGAIVGGGTVNAAANTGNGGGNTINNIGAGGSGLVMVRFKV